MTPTERKWFDRVRAWRESGLTADAFATGKDFAASSLRQWSHSLKKESAAALTTGLARVRLARVERAPERVLTVALLVEVGPARLHIPSGCDGATVRAVIGALLDGARVAR